MGAHRPHLHWSAVCIPESLQSTHRVPCSPSGFWTGVGSCTDQRQAHRSPDCPVLAPVGRQAMPLSLPSPPGALGQAPLLVCFRDSQPVRDHGQEG